MDISSWSSFLHQYNTELLTSAQLAGAIQVFDADLQAAARAGWLGYPGASDGRLLRCEERLSVMLPPGYRAFLATSNGWRLPGPHIPRLRSAEEIDWYAPAPGEIEAWSEGGPVGDEQYFVYGEQQQPYSLRPEYLTRALQISDGEIAGTAVYLLIPAVVTAEGEWEAWLFAHWLPGASRYRSFGDLMEAERRTFLQVEGHERGRPQPEEPLSVLQAKLPNLIEAIVNRARTYREIEARRPRIESVTEAATAQGLEEIAAKVRRLQAQQLDDATLLASLRSLEEAVSQEHMATHDRWVRSRKATDLLRLFGGAKAMSRAEGLRQAAGEIHWFIEKAGG